MVRIAERNGDVDRLRAGSFAVFRHCRVSFFRVWFVATCLLKGIEIYWPANQTFAREDCLATNRDEVVGDMEELDERQRDRLGSEWALVVAARELLKGTALRLETANDLSACD